MSWFAGILGRATEDSSGAVQAMFARMGDGREPRCIKARAGLVVAVRSTDGQVGEDNFGEYGNLCFAGDLLLCDRESLAGGLGTSAKIADSELVLRAYIKWGERCVDYLMGDFAFVISDGHSLFAARDALGVKPFYYSHQPGSFCFASEAMPVATQVSSALNETRIADYLVFPLEHVDKTSTFYRDVLRLPPACSLKFEDGSVSVRKYWQADPDRSIRFRHDREYTEAFAAVFEQAVQDRLTHGGKSASMLSGGVDSSTVVGFASKMSDLTTYSTVEWHEPCEETRFIHMTAESLAVKSRMISLNTMDAFLPAVFNEVSSVGEPFDHYMIQAMLVYLTARGEGHHWMFDGLEGDMLHSLPLTYPSGLLREGKLIAGIAEVYHLWRNTYDRQIPLSLLYFQRIRQIGLPDSLAPLRQLRRRMGSSEPLGRSLIDSDFAAREEVSARLGTLAASLYGSGQTLQAQHARNIEHPAICAAAERYDRVASRMGIEPRHPLMDRRLVEFSLALPWEQKYRLGFSKYQLRRIGRGRIPQAVSWRVGRDENAWRFIDRLIDARAQIMRERIGDDRQLLAPYITAPVLDRPRNEDLLTLYGLLCWLQRQQ